MVVVVAIEGVHGVGKTTLINMLRERGRTVIDEEFMDTSMNKYSPTKIARQIVWLANWIQRVVVAAENRQMKNILYPAQSTNTLYIDRSMLSALIYNTVETDKNTLEYIIQKSIGELKEMGIHIYTILLTDDKQEAWTRIQKRLEDEPERVKYDEHKEEHYKRIWGEYYREKRNLWNACMKPPMDMSEEETIQCLDNLVQRITNY